MNNKIFVFFLLLLLSNCASPGSALLGPAITGATTKNLAQASLSFGTNQVMKKVRTSYNQSKIKVKKIAKNIEDFELNEKYRKFTNFHK
tara:strand:+ start:281 stop:547 length:267 start_codon:yes stop_codon:yes gene_type:complete